MYQSVEPCEAPLDINSIEHNLRYEGYDKMI